MDMMVMSLWQSVKLTATTRTDLFRKMSLVNVRKMTFSSSGSKSAEVVATC